MSLGVLEYYVMTMTRDPEDGIRIIARLQLRSTDVSDHLPQLLAPRNILPIKEVMVHMAFTTVTCIEECEKVINIVSI